MGRWCWVAGGGPLMGGCWWQGCWWRQVGAAADRGDAGRSAAGVCSLKRRKISSFYGPPDKPIISLQRLDPVESKDRCVINYPFERGGHPKALTRRNVEEQGCQEEREVLL